MSDDQRLPTIDSARLRLRWLTATDVPALYEIFSNVEVTRYWSWTAYTELAQAEALLAEIHDFFRSGTLHQWGVARTEDDTVIGTCTLAQIDRVHRRTEIGFALGRAHWGQGLMREAVGALLQHAFGELRMRRVEADVDPRNAASLRLLERFGFEREGRLRERYEVGGETQDSVILGLLARQFVPLD
jgi:ribosomal-protein-alanine N-acetyltransferase